MELLNADLPDCDVQGQPLRLLRNGPVILKASAVPSLPEHRFCVLDGEELREGEGHSKAVQVSANAAANWGAPRTFIIRFKL
jgi:hypothetical protein